MQALTIEQTKKFLELRKQGYSPRYAKRMVTAREPVEYDWEDTGAPDAFRATHKEHTSVGVLDVVIKIKYDQDPDLSWIGEYSSTWSPGAENWHQFAKVPQRSRHNICQWFIPQFTYEEVLQDYKDLGRHEAKMKARGRVRHDMALLKAIQDGDTLVVGVVATAYLNGEELGEGSTWGIVFDPAVDGHWAVVNEAAGEVILEAVGQATENLCPHCHGSGRTDG